MRRGDVFSPGEHLRSLKARILSTIHPARFQVSTLHVKRCAHPDLPSTVFPSSTALCDDLFLSILHKDNASSKRRDTVALDDDGKRERLEGMLRAGSKGWVLSLALSQGTHTSPDLFPINATWGARLRTETTCHHPASRASIRAASGMSESLPFTHISCAYPPVIQAGARHDVSSSARDA